MADSVSSLTKNGSTGSATGSAASRTKLADNMDMFLKMLTTQLKNQDPLNPMEGTEFTNQLVQFANVEQQIQVNDNLEKMLSIQQSTTIGATVAYIGKEVMALTDGLPLEDGKANLSYTTPKDITSVTITIKDASGNTVYTKKGDAAAGTHEFTWDGKNKDGKQLDDGSYLVQVSATDVNKKTSDLETAVTGTVTSVAQANGEVSLFLDKIMVPLNDVVKVSGAKSTSSSTTP